MKIALRSIAAFLLTMVLTVGCNKQEEPISVEDPIDSHTYVDLGLPSGILWATCNVGADHPEEFGDFFAWGETTPKDIYDWKTYKYCCYIDERYVLNKYCTDSCYGFNGFVDNLTVLEPIDDAATVNWGADWRMPTGDEWKELFENTTWIWTAQNDVKGRLMTGPNGNSIFLPAAGYREDCDSVSTEVGIYWSSSLQTTLQVIAWSYHFTFENCHLCGSYERKRGQVVRAVRSET